MSDTMLQAYRNTVTYNHMWLLCFVVSCAEYYTQYNISIERLIFPSYRLYNHLISHVTSSVVEMQHWSDTAHTSLKRSKWSFHANEPLFCTRLKSFTFQICQRTMHTTTLSLVMSHDLPLVIINIGL